MLVYNKQFIIQYARYEHKGNEHPVSKNPLHLTCLVYQNGASRIICCGQY